MVPRRLLVTGGAGFVGTNFVHYWHEHHPHDRIVVLDALTYAGNLANLESVQCEPSFRFVHGDIRDETLVKDLLSNERLDTIIHFAAESHVDRSILGPDAFIEANVLGTHSLLKAARAIWVDVSGGPLVHRFHHVSTDEVYGSLGPNDPAFTEITPYSPNSPYAATKAAADHLVRAYHHTYGLGVTMSNCSNNYGPYQFPEKLIALTIVNILQGKSLPIYGDGLNIRDWLYVEDHCRGIERILEQGRIGETYNVGGNNEWTNIDIVKLVGQLVDDAFLHDVILQQRFPQAPAARGRTADTLITYVKDRLGHDRRYAIEASKIRTEINYNPHESFQTGKSIDL